MEYLSETEPRLLIKKYRAVFAATTIVEFVAFFVSLVDSVVAANIVGPDAFAGIGLTSPLLFIATFITAIISAGTLLEFTRQIGLFNKQRANEYFSEGAIMAVVSGAALALILFLIKDEFISSLDISPAVAGPLNDYYSIILFYFMLMPISLLLDNAAVADGDITLTIVANVAQVGCNVALSIILGMLFGVKGIAFSTLLSKILFIALMSLWYFGKESTIRFIPRFSFRDAAEIIAKGSVKASTYALAALMTMILNDYIIGTFDISTFNIWIVIQKILGLQAVFIGQALALQPLLGSLFREDNTKAICTLAGKLNRDILLTGVLSAVPVLFLTKLTLRVFGVTGGAAFDEGIFALRVTSLTIVLMSMTIYFFIYYYMTDKYLLSVIVAALKDLFCPVFAVLLLNHLLNNDPDSIWIGLAAALAAALLVSFFFIIARYGKNEFPYLIPREHDDRIHIFSFYLEEDTIVRMSMTAGELLRECGYSRSTQMRVSVCIEDISMLIKEKNADAKKPILAECTLITEDDGVRLILRDSGVIFDLSDTDATVNSFLQYSVANMINAIDSTVYITAAGYNRNELYFQE